MRRPQHHAHGMGNHEPHEGDDAHKRDRTACEDRHEHDREDAQSLHFQAEVARDYVRRDDFVQVIATINTRIDNFALRIEAAVLNLPGGKAK